MISCYQDIREQAELDGYKVDDKTFFELVTYASKKAEISGHDESYLSLLLPDVIKEWYISRAINICSIAMMQIQNYFKEVKGEWRSNNSDSKENR